MFKTIKSKLIILMSALIIALIFVGTFSIINLEKVSDQSNKIVKEAIPSIIMSEELNTMTSDFRILNYRHIASQDITKMDEVEVEMDKQQEEIKKIIDLYGKQLYSEEDKVIYDIAKDEWEKYLVINETVMELSRELKTDEAMALMMGESKEAFDTSSSSLIKLAEFNKQLAVKLSEEANNTTSTAENISITIISILTIVSIIFCIIDYSGNYKVVKYFEKGDICTC